MMRVLLLAGIVLLAACFTGKEDYFEGAIVYKHSFESRNPNISATNLGLSFGTKSDFYFKEGSYLQANNGRLIMSMIKSAKDNKTYIQLYKSDSVECIRGSVKDYEVLKIETADSTFDILNYPCTRTTLTVRNVASKDTSRAVYYYHGDFKVDPEWFKRSVSGYEYDKFKAIRAVPLKIEVIKKNYTMIMEAIEVKREKLDNVKFENLSGKPLKYLN